MSVSQLPGPQVAARYRLLSNRKSVLIARIALATSVGLISLVVCDRALTWLERRGYLGPRYQQYFENCPAPWFEVDLRHGFRVGSTPYGVLLVDSQGRLEPPGRQQGNNWGFCDRDDFQPSRGDEPCWRIAVCGDSMTHGYFLTESWPAAVERLWPAGQRRVDLLNLALDGTGLYNWANILEQTVSAGDWELDGVVFACAFDDLHRTFTLYDDAWDGRQHRMLVARLPADELVPAGDVAQVRARMIDVGTYFPTLAPTRFRELAALSTRSGARVPLLGRKPVGSFLLDRLWGSPWSSVRFQPAVPSPQPGSYFNRHEQTQIERIRRVLRDEGWAAVVIDLPERGELSPSEVSRGKADEDFFRRAPDREYVEFAQRLGATLLDGRRAFRGLAADAHEALWLEGDIHWNQAGSTAFARWAAGELTSLSWGRRRPTAWSLRCLGDTEAEMIAPLDRPDWLLVRPRRLTSNESYVVSLRQTGIRVVESGRYRLDFLARGEETRPLQVRLVRETPAAVPLGPIETVMVGPTTQRHRWEFIATESCEAATLEFLLAGHSAPVELGDVHLWLSSPLGETDLVAP